MSWLFWVIAGVVLVAALPLRIELHVCLLSNPKIRKDVQIGIVSDLHSTSFGKNQKHLLKKIEKADVDLLVFPGDLLDDRVSDEPVFALLQQLQGIPMYYVDGNHEQWYPEKNAAWKKKLVTYGVEVVEDCSVFLEEYGIEIAGIPCMRRGVNRTPESVSSLFQTNAYRILLSHIPSYANFYRQVACDLILAGHNHGGQWRIPILHKGLYSPSEGLFPKFTGGLYTLGKNQMFVSRGLTTSARGIVRLFNNPEVCVIQLTKQNTLNQNK